MHILIRLNSDCHRYDTLTPHSEVIVLTNENSGGAIGAGLFVGSGAALQSGGPASLVICYLIIGIMLLFTCQALAELAVLYPVNGAFFTYIVRFIDPSWGFAMGWDYAISWLTILPFELVAASITIQYWRDDLNMGEFRLVSRFEDVTCVLSLVF